MRYLWLVMAVLFVVAGAVQFNDPDPWLWVGLYGVAALVCGAWPRRARLSQRGQMVVLLGAFVTEIGAVLWGFLLLHDVLAVGTLDLSSEVQREFGGLLIVAVTMTIAISSARLKKDSAGPVEAG